jgi:hypothetical protein
MLVASKPIEAFAHATVLVSGGIPIARLSLRRRCYSAANVANDRIWHEQTFTPPLQDDVVWVEI